MKTTPIVTKEWLAAKVAENPSKTIGRALLALYNYQTSSEQTQTTTKIHNGVGFSKPDARIGSIGARMFRSHGKLEPWVIKVWTKPAKDGFPRITKYVEQLNQIALSKATEVLPCCSTAELSAATKSTLL